MEKEKTGLASIDMPWLKQYSEYDAKEKIQFETNKTVWDVAQTMLEKYSDINFIEYFGRNISRSTFSEYVEMWARTLRALDVQVNDVVPIYTPATPEGLAIFLAANAIGAIPYFQKIDITPEALEEETSEAKIAVVFDGLWSNVEEVFSKEKFKKIIVTSASDSMMFPLKQMTKIKDYFDRKKKQINIPNGGRFIWADDAKKISTYFSGEYKVPFEPGRLAAITTSSGTTSSLVKGIMDTNEGILASMACLSQAGTGYTVGKRTLTCFPPTASTSLNCLQLLPIFTGGTIIFDPRVDISLWYNQLMQYKPDITITTGPVWEKYIQDILKREQKTGKIHDLSWQDCMIMGGAGTSPEILNKINSVIRERGAKNDIYVGYGFSEVFGVLSVSKYNGNYKEKENNRPAISVGIPLPGYTVGIFDENGIELPYGKGLRGELRIKAPSNMEGYYKKPELTSKTIVNGWILSGDLCEIDSDGNIYCYGRIRNQIKSDTKTNYLFDISNDIKHKFKLHDILLEKKELIDGSTSLNIYFVQEENARIESKELIKLIDDYVQKYGITIDGYIEQFEFLTIDPTTLKPKTREKSGFVKYREDKKYEVSYNIVKDGIYEKTETEILEKVLKR